MCLFFSLLVSHEDIDVTLTNSSKTSALHYFIRNLDSKLYNEQEHHIVLKSIQKGLSVNASNSSGETLLHNACFSKNLSVVKVLIENGADINAVTKRGESPLHWALRTANEDINQTIQLVTFLLANGADVTLKGKDGNAFETVKKNTNNPELIKLVEEADKKRKLGNSEEIRQNTHYATIPIAEDPEPQVEKKTVYSAIPAPPEEIDESQSIFNSSLSKRQYSQFPASDEEIFKYKSKSTVYAAIPTVEESILTNDNLDINNLPPPPKIPNQEPLLQPPSQSSSQSHYPDFISRSSNISNDQPSSTESPPPLSSNVDNLPSPPKIPSEQTSKTPRPLSFISPSTPKPSDNLSIPPPVPSSPKPSDSPKQPDIRPPTQEERYQTFASSERGLGLTIDSHTSLNLIQNLNNFSVPQNEKNDPNEPQFELNSDEIEVPQFNPDDLTPPPGITQTKRT